jgi:excisionase family DNA binding protein
MGKKQRTRKARKQSPTAIDAASAASELHPESRDILTVEQAADYLQLSRATLFKLMKEQRLPHAKLGGSIRFSKAQLLGWVEAHAARR